MPSREANVVSPIANVIPCSFLDFPGRVAYAAFLRDCNFRCPMCHNHELFAGNWEASFGKKFVLAGIRSLLPWVDACVLSGGEALLHIDFLEDLCQEILALGLEIKIDTNGSHPYALERLLRKRLVQCVALDLKAPFDVELYSRATGVWQDRSSLALIRDSMRVIKRFDTPYILRTTVVPGILEKGDILSLGRDLLGEERWILQDFVPENALDPALREIRGYGGLTLREWAKEVRDRGYVKRVQVLARD